MQELALSLQAFMAPRMLRWQGWVAEEPTLPGRSAGTGWSRANDISRVYAYSWVERIAKTCAGAYLAQRVDDVPFRAIGTPDTIKAGIVRSVCRFPQCAQGAWAGPGHRDDNHGH